jgi:hypothetical protein
MPAAVMASRSRARSWAHISIWRRVFNLHVEGRTRVPSETASSDQVNDSIAEVLHESTATPRLVLTF